MNNLKITAGGSPESYCFTVTLYREVVEDPELPSPLKQPNAAFFHGRPGQRPDRNGKVTGERHQSSDRLYSKSMCRYQAGPTNC